MPLGWVAGILVALVGLMLARPASGQCDYQAMVCSGTACSTCCYSCERGYDAQTGRPFEICSNVTSCVDSPAPADSNSESPTSSYSDDDVFTPPADFSDPPSGPPIPTDPETVCALDPNCTLTRVQRTGSSVLDCKKSPDLPACASVGLDEATNHKPPRPPGPPRPPSPHTPQGGGDPVSLATGELRLSPIDLSYAGPVRPLQFSRSYASQSDRRGLLGSNWTHRFEAYLRPVTQQTPGAPAVCLTSDRPCVYVYDDEGSQTLFIRPNGQDFFLAPTRNDATLHETTAGWTLRQPDGQVLTFNPDGYLIGDRDRFGNGFTINQQETSLYRLYKRWCLGDGPTTYPNDDPRVCAALAYAFEDGPPASWPTWKLPDGVSVPLVTEKCRYQWRADPNIGVNCRAVGGQDLVAEFGIGAHLYVAQCGNGPKAFREYTDPVAHELTLANDALQGGLRGCTITYTLCDEWPFDYRDPVDRFGQVTSRCTGVPWTRFSGKLAWPKPTRERVIAVEDGILYEEVALPEEPSSYVDREAILGFLAAGSVDLKAYGRPHGMFYTPPSTYGARRYRPTGVQDDLGRSLVFQYVEPLDIAGIDTMTPAHLGLLKSVHGPDGRTVSFQYSRPAGYPQRLNELFLTRVGVYGGGLSTPGVRYATTPDGDTVDHGSTHYVYDWPNEGGGSYVDFLYDLWRSRAATRDGRRVAPLDALRYIESIADNITTIVRNRPDAEVIELESRYYRYPTDESVDRVAAQRFGSGPPSSYDGWATTAPRMDLRYFNANPRLAIAEVSTDLVPELRQKYPRELVPQDVRAAAAANRPLGYFQPDETVDPDITLRRTSLPCGSIARLDTQLTFTSAGLTVDDLRRAREAFRLDANRICAWTVVDERDGTRRYLGFNARGDTLVQAVYERDDERYFFTERIYDEDGRPLASRAPTSRLTPGWHTEHGATLFSYRGYGTLDAASWRARGNLLRQVDVPVGGGVENISGDSTDQDIERSSGRLTRFAYEPAFNQVARIQWGVVLADGRDRIEYEQLHTFEGRCSVTLPPSLICDGPRLSCFVRSGAANELLEALDGMERCWSRGDACTGSERRATEVLDAVARGVASPRDSRDAQSKQIGDWVDRLRALIKEARASTRQAERRDAGRRLSGIRSEIENAIDRLRAQLPDLRGRLDPGVVPNQCAQKRPDAVMLRDPAHPETARFIDLDWNTAGLPTRLHERQGTTTRFEYYAPLSHNSIGSANRGLLARVTFNRFDEDYGAIFDRTPCADGKGPYRFVLSPDCGLRQAIDWPVELMAALERAGNGTDTTQATFEYSVLGLPSARIEDSRRWTFVRDPAGRVLETTTPEGVTTSVRRTWDGFPARIETRHQPPGSSSPVLVGRVRQSFSQSGYALRICRELTADGCAGFEQFDVAANDLLSVGRPYQLTVREYDREDRLSRLVDPIGLVTEWDYNARGLPIRIRHHQLGSTASQGSHTGYCYSERGQPVRVLHGANVRDETCGAIRPPIVTSEPGPGSSGPPTLGTPAPPQLVCPDPGPASDHTMEIRSYDGLGRLNARTDFRKVRHRYRWTTRDEPAGEDVGEAVCGRVETRRRTYDDHGQLASVVRNGAHTTSFVRGPWGRSVKVSSTGVAPAYAIFGPDGAPAWVRDQAGDEQIMLHDIAAQIKATLTLRRDHASGSITQTRALSRFDVAGRPVNQTVSGRDADGRTAQQERSWEWTPLGHRVVEHQFDGRTLSYEDRNLLGWPRRICEQDACATVHFNGRGDVILAYDPAGQLSTFRWSIFGEPAFARFAGDANTSSWSYDSLRRITGRVDPGQVSFTYRYDGRGDLVRIESQGNALQELQWDEQGRLTRATDWNRRSAATFPVSTSFVYDEWGRIQEEKTEFPLGLALRTVTRKWTPTQSEATEAITFADGLYRGLQYDGAGRLVSVQYAGDAQSPPSAELRLAWQRGRYSGRDYRRLPLDAAPVIADMREFDALERPRGLRTTGPSGAAGMSIAAAYDATGRVASLATLVNGAAAGSWRGYAYDSTGRLSDLLEAENVAPPAVDGTPLTNVLSVGDSLGAVQWKYARDTIIGSTNEISAPAVPATRWRTPLPRGPGYQLQQVSVNGMPETGVAYDAHGRISKLDTRIFEYDVLGRLSAVRSADGAILEQYLYGAGSELRGVLGSDGAPLYTFVHDGNRPAVAFDATGKPAWDATWLPGGSDLLLWRDLQPPGRTIYPVTDFRHDVVGAWDVDAGHLAGLARFNPEGRLTSQGAAGTCSETSIGDVCPGAGGMPLGFGSAWRSPTTGLVLLGRRWYSPVVGEFLSPDPLGVGDSWNPYAYGRFDPINRWDPDGRESRPSSEDPQEVVQKDGYNFLDVHHPDGTTSRYQITFYVWKGELGMVRTPLPGRPGDPCYEDPALCTCSDAIQFCTGRVDPDLFPWEMWQLGRAPFELFKLGRGLYSLGSRGINLLRGLRGGTRTLDALEDVVETATQPAPPSVVIPQLVTAGKETRQLVGEAMQQVKTVEGFDKRVEMIRGLYAQITKAYWNPAKGMSGWNFQEARGLDGSRIFYGTTDATFVRPDGAVFAARDFVNDTKVELFKSGQFSPPYQILKQVVP